MPMNVSTCNLTVNSNENTTGLVHYYIFLTICMCKYYDKYIKPFSKRPWRNAPAILVFLATSFFLYISVNLQTNHQ